MDRTSPSEGENAGSIPAESTIEKGALGAFLNCAQEYARGAYVQESKMLRAFCEAKSATCTETVCFDSVLAFLQEPHLKAKQCDEVVEDRLVMTSFGDVR